MVLRVLVVCTGNVCRSPMAERLLAARLGPLVEASSAGTGALVGAAADPTTAALVARAGGSTAGHVARRLDEHLLDGADLVLAATRAHRSAVLALRPSLLRRCCTVREAGRLAGHLAPELTAVDAEGRLRELAGQLARARGRWPVADPADDDLEDPYRRGEEVHLRVAGQVGAAVAAFAAAAVTGVTGVTALPGPPGRPAGPRAV